MKLTREDWPSYDLENGGLRDCTLLKVSFMQLSTGDFRTCVWGADDFGMEFDVENREIAWDKFQKIIVMDYVSQASLKKLGFVLA